MLNYIFLSLPRQDKTRRHDPTQDKTTRSGSDKFTEEAETRRDTSSPAHQGDEFKHKTTDKTAYKTRDKPADKIRDKTAIDTL